MHGSRPHIVVILVDDLGYHNVGFANHRLPTPAINALARSGAVLRAHYAYKYCSPSRASFMSGRLPIHVSEDNPSAIDSPGGADLRMTLLPQKLRDAGYRTALYGKWHCGARQTANLPTRRGFDRFFGILSGSADHYTSEAWEASSAVDLFDDDKPAYGRNNTLFSCNLFTTEAVKHIHRHNESVPLFLVLSLQETHGPNQCPKHYQSPSVQHAGRRVFEGMVACVDEATGNVTSALEARGMWERTFMLWTSDNGGVHNMYANNYPLRGGKGTDFEGGVKVAAFVAGGALRLPRGTDVHARIHLCDCNGRCAKPEWSGAARGALVRLPGLNCSERYFDALHCAGRSLLFSRRDVPTPWPGDDEAGGRVASAEDAYSLLDWETVLRTSPAEPTTMTLAASSGFDVRRLGFARAGLPSSLRLSHNAALMCANNGTALVAYGGRHGHRYPYAGHSQVTADVGIRRSSATLIGVYHNDDGNGHGGTDGGGGRLRWSPPLPILDGDVSRPESSCVEARGFGHCEFDGKLSAIARIGGSGEVLLYARANTGTEMRFVQVTRSADGLRNWSGWQLLRFRGLSPSRDTNIYYFAVTEVFGVHGECRLAGVFPAVLGGKGCIYLAHSDDPSGVTWSAPRCVLPSVVHHGVRTADNPIGGVMRDPASGKFHLLVQHNVAYGKYPKNASCRLYGAYDSHVCRYELKPEMLGVVGACASPAAAAAAARTAHARHNRTQVVRWGQDVKKLIV